MRTQASNRNRPQPERRHRDKTVIGWREWLSIPTLGIESIKAKVDTGARTSSIHAFDLKTFTDRGAPHASFVIQPLQRRRNPRVECIAEIFDERVIKSSTGHEQRRYVIRVDVGLAGQTWPIELTLANRDEMGFRLLLGRQAIRGRFLIDTARSFIADRKIVMTRPPRKPKRKQP